MKNEFVWKDDENRPLKLYRPCPCGCAERLGDAMAGYISGSDEDGNGVTVKIRDEETFEALSRLMTVQES